MEKMANNSKEHYIVCGLGSVGFHIVSELYSTKRPHLVVDVNKNNIERALELFQDEVFIEGDATDNITLLKAGIEKAKGLFAVTGDDNQNLIISLTAKQLNPNLRVVARCNEIKNSEKIKQAGADAVEIVACPEKSCKFLIGSRRAEKRIEYIQGLLEKIGYEPQRVGISRKLAQSPEKLIELAKARADAVRSFDTNPMKGE